MPRRARAPQLENRTNRLKLPVAGKPVFTRIAPNISLGYRRTKTAGTWVLKVTDKDAGNWTKRIGIADDHEESDGVSILTFWQAQDLARGSARSESWGSTPRHAPLTVQRAADAYLASLEVRSPRTAYDTRRRLQRLFLPKYGESRIEDLTRRKLEAWRDGLVRKDNDPERRRKSQDTANRVLSIVKALLNHAVSDRTNRIADDSAWRLVRPFRGVSRARELHFTAEQVKRLVAAADEEAFQNLLIAGFLTGARYGELTACLVRHFEEADETLRVPRGKTGPRFIVLQPEAIDFFKRVVGQRQRDEPLLKRPDGQAWKPSDQQRRMGRALAAAQLDEGTFYALRHTYISRSIEAGVPLTVLAENCGTSVLMIEKTYAKVLADKRREFISRGAPRLYSVA